MRGYLPGIRLVSLLLLGAPLWLLGVLTPVAGLAGVAYLLLLVGICAWEIWNLPRADQLGVSRELPLRFAYDSTHEVAVLLANLQPLPLRLQVRDELPAALHLDDPVQSGILPGAGQARVAWKVHAVARGIHPFGAVVLRVSVGLGLIMREHRYPVADRARVYPRFQGTEDLGLVARVAEREEVVRRPRRVRGSGTDFESLKPYVPGDDPRIMDWKASARRGSLVARQLQVERGQQLALLIDTGRLMGGRIGEYSRLEHVLNATVRLGYVVQRRGDVLSLATFSNKVGAFLPPVRGAAIMPRLLETLCPVAWTPEESDYWQAVAQVMNRLTRRSLLVLFTEVLDPAAASGLLSNLRRAASRHLVLCVVLSEPAVRQAARGIPSTAEEAWEKAAACDVLRRRRLALEQMRRQGIMVLETDPEHLSVSLVRRYLEIRQADLQ